MSSPASVAKPASAGSGRTAIANTRRAYVNVRTGPGAQYEDIGDILDNSLVVYYPNTKTGDDWVWVEQRGLRGWLFSGVVEFEDAVGGTTSADHTPTPYDNKVAVWHWKGDGIAETTIEEFVANLKRFAPNVNAVFVKTSDGADWMGEFDDSPMAINGTESIDRWVQVLERNNLEFHAWCVPKGIDPGAEANIISAVCQSPGVKSMILDVEPYAGFWQAGAEGVRPLMLAVRRNVDSRFHIGMSVDPRPWHYDTIFPQEWFPFVNSVHPQCYWDTFRRTPEDVLTEMYTTWGGYGRPIVPALQGDAPLIDQYAAHTLTTQRHNAPGLSWWRYGVISQFGAVNSTVKLTTSPADPIDEPTENFAEEVLIIPDGDGFRRGTYTGQVEFHQFEGTWGWNVLYKPTEVSTSKVWAEWKTTLPTSGRYEISAFVPARHATSTKARYKIHGIKGTNTEVIVDINQGRNRNKWVPLGIFDLVKESPNAGRVFLNDVTGEEGKIVAFDAIRFRRLITSQPGTPTTGDPNQPTNPNPGPIIVGGVFVADGYDAPVGNGTERRSSQLWPSGWKDASPFGILYFIGTPSEAYHTGADLNWGAPHADLGLPVYAPASGVVTFAAKIKIWGNVVVIRHDPLYTPQGQVLYSRHGHVQNMKVKPGDRVQRGDQIAEVGNAFGRFVPHLHYDLSPTSVLETRPSDWPGRDRAKLLRNYIDPLQWTRRNRPS